MNDSNEKKSAEPIRILLVDDHAKFRQGLRAFLDSYPDLEVVGESGNGEDAAHSVQILSPSLVLMDISMPKLNGIEATARIKAINPHVVVLGLSINSEESSRLAMIRAGATAVISKGAVIEQLYEKITECFSLGLCQP